MASGKVHNRASAIISVPTGALLASAASPVEGLGAFLGCLLGIILTPDLDQIGVSASEWGMVKRLGPIGFLWMAIWWPYAIVIPHRSPLSHWPTLSTLIRVAYSITLLMIIWIILGRPVLVMPAWGPAFLRGGLAGLMVSDMVHFLLDSFPKRKKRKR